MSGPQRDEPALGAAPTPAEPPMIAFRSALRRYPARLLIGVLQKIGVEPLPGNAIVAQLDLLIESLDTPEILRPLVDGLDHGPRLALSLIALGEEPRWPFAGLSHALAALGVKPRETIRTLVERGLLAAMVGQDAPPIDDLGGLIEGTSTATLSLRAHPGALALARTILPEPALPAGINRVRQVRETDALEPILRLAALWQRMEEAPLRQTQQGMLYKRDRERVEDDPTLAGPIADALEPLPDMAPLWLTLALATGLAERDAAGERISAAKPEFWDDNAFHLSQMVATRWLALRDWSELAGRKSDEAPLEPASPYLRISLLLWLATVPEGDWVALDDLSTQLGRIYPTWDRALLVEPPAPLLTLPPARVTGKYSKANKAAAGPAVVAAPVERETVEVGTLEAVLLGAAYQFGLLRAAEEEETGRRVVQLSALGRYVLALGPPPEGRAVFEHFLYVQPNFEIIAYRQGLTPGLIGRLSRFLLWTRVGAALELKLTPESVYRGLEGGLAPDSMVREMAEHSQRALPPGVADSVRTWSVRRDKVTYHAATTLIEFATVDDLDAALGLWEAEGRKAPARVAERMLLVEDETTIPFQRFRMAGSRDYRRPPESCVEVAGDGVTLTLDLARSDLLIDAELARFADEIPADPPSPGSGTGLRRRFVVSRKSLARAVEQGATPQALARWFSDRTGGEVPASIRLLLHAANPEPGALSTSRPLILRTRSSELLDGLAQHPSTAPLLGERLGPTAVEVAEPLIESLYAALSAIGLTLEASPEDSLSAQGDDPSGSRQPRASGRTRSSS
ncbi:hypothetical protein EP7_004673 [Isosphaeraceae bacterium EP7]